MKRFEEEKKQPGHLRGHTAGGENPGQEDQDSLRGQPELQHNQGLPVNPQEQGTHKKRERTIHHHTKRKRIRRWVPGICKHLNPAQLKDSLVERSMNFILRASFSQR